MLAIAVPLMLGATTGGAFAHEIQHAAHHTAGMHSSGVCAWMCATAGTLAAAILQPQQCQLVQLVVLPDGPSAVFKEYLTPLLPRAPPLQ
jgi:hypothetical protein